MDDCGYIPFGRSLGNCPNIDTRIAQSLEHFSTGTGLVFHVVANKRDNRKSLLHHNRVDLSKGYFVSELCIYRSPCFLGNPFFDCNTHGMQ
ncbi:hypothetical protein SDC9_97952 [bioreactor metagenome]|uniref:Uncharacterized protein n=1 Tax=bioreactor metagenome TaxID=1076179 RepID=A0A645ADC2_9ZZZZ